MELFPFVILNGFLYRISAYAMIVHTQADKLLLQIMADQLLPRAAMIQVPGDAI